MKKKIVTFGVFDYFHLGHLRLFKNCKNNTGATYLIVAMQDGDYILKRKPWAKIFYTTDQRKEILESIKEIDEVYIYKDVEDDIKKIDFDILAIGPDQQHNGFQKAIQWCKDHDKEVILLPRTEGVSSTMIKTQITEQY